MAKERHDNPPAPGGSKHQTAPPRLEGAAEMPDALRQEQAQAQQPAPKPVKLEPARDELGQPADAPPVPPKAAPEPVPRLIDQSERSPDPERLRRFKVRCDQPFGTQPTRYVLARKGDRQGAIDHYLETTGLKAVLETFPDGQRPIPLMAVKELPD